MQNVANLGLRAPDWPETVEGTYLRIDIPLIVPVLLDWLESQQTGKLPGHYLMVNTFARIASRHSSVLC